MLVKATRVPISILKINATSCLETSLAENDICVLVFMDGTTPFHPKTVASEFNHVFVVVQPVGSDAYRVSVVTKEGVPAFWPCLPKPAVFKRSFEFRNLLLAMLVNGERAAFLAPAFAERLQRTAEMQLKLLVVSNQKKN